MMVDLDKVTRKICEINLEFMKYMNNKFVDECIKLDSDTKKLLKLVYEKINEYDYSMNQLVGGILYSLTQTHYKEIE